MTEPLDLDAIKAMMVSASRPGKWVPDTMAALVAEVERHRAEPTVIREDVGNALDRLSVVVDALAAAVDDLAEVLHLAKAWPTTNEEATG